MAASGKIFVFGKRQEIRQRANNVSKEYFENNFAEDETFDETISSVVVATGRTSEVRLLASDDWRYNYIFKRFHDIIPEDEVQGMVSKEVNLLMKAHVDVFNMMSLLDANFWCEKLPIYVPQLISFSDGSIAMAQIPYALNTETSMNQVHLLLGEPNEPSHYRSAAVEDDGTYDLVKHSDDRRPNQYGYFVTGKSLSDFLAMRNGVATDAITSEDICLNVGVAIRTLLHTTKIDCRNIDIIFGADPYSGDRKSGRCALWITDFGDCELVADESLSRRFEMFLAEGKNVPKELHRFAWFMIGFARGNTSNMDKNDVNGIVDVLARYLRVPDRMVDEFKSNLVSDFSTGNAKKSYEHLMAVDAYKRSYGEGSSGAVPVRLL